MITGNHIPKGMATYVRRRKAWIRSHVADPVDRARQEQELVAMVHAARRPRRKAAAT